MAALGTRFLTLLDATKGSKQVGKVAEVLVQENSMLNDIPYTEMNEGTVHKEEIRSALPAVYYRKANQAIPPSKTTTEERVFTAAHFESKSQMDTAVAARGGRQNIAYHRWNQAQGHLQSHALETASLMIYGSPVDSNRKTPGFFDIYSTLNTAEPTSKQIVDAGGIGTDNTSILLVVWGERSVFGVYPKGTEAGLSRVDRSPGNKEIQIQALDPFGNPGTFWGFEEDFSTDHGLVVKDYRQAARAANIDVSNLVTNSGAANLIDVMRKLTYKVHSLSAGKPVFYVNRTVEAALDAQATAQVGLGGGLRYDNYQGQSVLMFRGIPIRRMDALINGEARVVA